MVNMIKKRTPTMVKKQKISKKFKLVPNPTVPFKKVRYTA